MLSHTQSAISQSNILVVSAQAKDLIEIEEKIQSQLPESRLFSVANANEFDQVVKEQQFDLVVLDQELQDKSTLEIIQSLRLSDSEPAVLVITKASDPKVLAELFDLRCQKYMLREGNWLEQIGLAIRRTIRVKKLEDENISLLSNLTQANALLEERNKKLDQFSMVLAHDIRGILGGISMRLECALEHSQKIQDQSLQKLLQGGFDSSRRLLEIVQETYQYAKLGAEATKMDFFDLKQLIDQVVEDLYLDNLEIEFRFDLAVENIQNQPQQQKIWGNINLIRRVFINLISNALKYNNSSQKKIIVGIRNISTNYYGKFANIYIEDNGQGISEEDLDNIFELYHRSGKQQTEGSGVGLSVVRKIVELHMGHVEVESKLGHGSRFTISLPVVPLKAVG